MVSERSSNQSHPLDYYMNNQSTDHHTIAEDLEIQLTENDKQTIKSISEQSEPHFPLRQHPGRTPVPHNRLQNTSP